MSTSNANDGVVVVNLGNQATTTNFGSETPVEEEKPKKMRQPSKNKMRTDHSDKEKS